MKNKFNLSTLATYVILTVWSFIVLFPVWTMVVNSFKLQRDIFRDPFSPPTTLMLEGYRTVWSDGRFDLYFRNSLFVTGASLFFILFFGSLGAYALAQWKSRLANLVYVFFIAGLMIPIRIGTINIFQLLQSLNLIDSVLGLIPVYVAMGLPIAVFVLTDFIRAVPAELADAARVDGASEWRIYLSLVVPLIRPALGTVAIFNLIPIWNDLWFPLIFIQSEENRTVTLGVSLLFGQYQTDWNLILCALSLAAVPVLVLYLLMSRQFIRGLTAGAVKG